MLTINYSVISRKIMRRVFGTGQRGKQIMQSNEPDWSPDLIKDEVLRTKFITLPEIIADWVDQHTTLADAEILDFGCGEGITALGLALQYAPARVVGIDIMPDPERCLPVAKTGLGLTSLPDNLELHQVEPGHLHNSNDRFDIIYSWSVFEHVDMRVIDDVIELLYNSLKPNGVVFIQIAPLYYSSEGSHLYDFVREPWGHLLHQSNIYSGKLMGAKNIGNEDVKKSLMSTYTTLNRITAPELERRFTNKNFKVIRKYTTRDEIDPPEMLTEIYNRDVLTTNQIVLLLEKNA
jgi:2-polyprenyl-3-methyl-5-hydroxy-6-metoxy-1,4-benzoquinol methylase